MTEESSLKQLSAETRAKLRSTQILTSLPQIVSELLQNSIDSGASQIDIGVDCEEWCCWVMDNGTGFSKDSLAKIGKGSDAARYNSSKAYTPASLESISTFGFRGEALSSMADLCCLEISSRTARARESWSVILKAGKSLYTGPSIRWRRESAGTVVSVLDAFFSLPVRRSSHPSPNKTIELIRHEVEAYALVFPIISFSFRDVSRATEGNPNKSHILKIPKTRTTLAAFRHVFGRALTQSVDEIDAISGELKIEGFISLVGAHTKSYQFLYINRHPLSSCDLHRLIDNRFTASSFAKHAYDETGETSLRPIARRSTRKGEKRPIYVLNLTIPTRHIDNCLEPAKSAVQLDNKNLVTSFLSSTVQTFLVRHGFVLAKRANGDISDGPQGKKRKLATSMIEASASKNDSLPPGPSEASRSETPGLFIFSGDGSNATRKVWQDPATGEAFIIDPRTGNSYPQCTPRAVGASGPNGASPKQQTLGTLHLIPMRNNVAESGNTANEEAAPDWLQEALQANEAYGTKEPKIPSLPLSGGPGPDDQNCLEHHPVLPSQYLQPGALNFAASQIRFRKEDLHSARIIDQVDQKFIACLLEHGSSGGGEACEDSTPPDGRILILIDQHAADERVRVERFLRTICHGFICHHDGSGGVETIALAPPLPVLLTRREASRLSDVAAYQKAFESWGFRFSGLPEARVDEDPDTESSDGAGYVQVFVSAIPEVVSEKLLSGNELQDLIKGYLGTLESEELSIRDSSSQLSSVDADKEIRWIKALRWCPRELLALINSKACRGAIMFNDPLNSEQCERLVKQLSATAFPFQCAHGRPSLVPLTHLASQNAGRELPAIKWERVASL
ncbi:hypothetical protein F5I97DRAFT_1861022 [Phlebopus sp. FC_14]|nr:hypothetical protein F5I97DRAFT_1861022 [Phlebopus sp. FC_14]